MAMIVRVLGSLLASGAARYGIFIGFMAFSRYGRRLWRWFWE